MPGDIEANPNAKKINRPIVRRPRPKAPSFRDKLVQTGRGSGPGPKAPGPGAQFRGGY